MKELRSKAFIKFCKYNKAKENEVINYWKKYNGWSDEDIARLSKKESTIRILELPKYLYTGNEEDYKYLKQLWKF